MKLFKICLFALSAICLAACHPKAPTAAAPAVDNVATVNGTGISRGLFNFLVTNATQGKGPAALTQQQKEGLLDNLVRAEVISQQLEKTGGTKDPQVAYIIELSRLSALQQSFNENFAKENKPTDAELKKEYDAEVALAPHTEYELANIVVPSADVATKIIADLSKGAKFEDLAKKNSTDPTKNQGGNMGWQSAETLPKPFADAVAALKPGEVIHAPLQTQYGWHVIKVLQSRPLAPKPYDSMKDQVSQAVLTKKYKTYVDDLLAKAQIDKKI